MSNFLRRVVPFHYGWIVALSGGMVIFASFGIARYVYTMLLPSMQAELGLNYSQAGLIGTANFTGYLTAVLFAPYLLQRYTPRVLITVGLLLIGLAMCSICMCRDYYPILSLYTLAGFGGGLCNIPLMLMITNWFRSDQRGKAVGMVVCGNGTGIMFTGLLIPYLNSVYGEAGWRCSWGTLGFVILVASCLAGMTLRDHPSEFGLEPIGRSTGRSAGAGIEDSKGRVWRLLFGFGFLYWTFGVTFMVFGTFIVETMIVEFGFTEAKAGMYWSWVGAISFFSGLLFGSLSDVTGRKLGLALVFTVQTIAYLLVGMRPDSGLLLVSILLYGLAVFAIPTILPAAIGDYFGPSRLASSMSIVTIFFAAGQAMGPGIGGIIIDMVGTFGPVYVGTACLTAVAAVSSLLLPGLKLDGKSIDPEVQGYVQAGEGVEQGK